jgi:hypothetical protein
MIQIRDLTGVKSLGGRFDKQVLHISGERGRTLNCEIYEDVES